MAKVSKFKLLLDENIPNAIAQWLRSIKPDWMTIHVSEIGLSGKTDKKIFNWAQEQKTAILTFDEDFADRRTFIVNKHYGIIRLRIWPTTVEKVEEALTRLLNSFSPDEIAGSLIIIDNSKIRLRKYP